MRKILDILIPRFITEDVACYEHDDGVCYPAFPMAHFNPEEDREPDAIIRIRSFNLFGFGLVPGQSGDAMSFSEWMQSRTS